MRWNKLYTAHGCGAVAEWIMMCMTLLSLVFLCTLKKLRDELREELSGKLGMAIFMGSLFTLTVVLSITTMRKLSGRVMLEASDICEAEC